MLSCWLQVVCGALHSLALVDDGTVAAFGDNEFGQTGLESSGTQVCFTLRVHVYAAYQLTYKCSCCAHCLAGGLRCPGQLRRLDC